MCNQSFKNQRVTKRDNLLEECNNSNRHRSRCRGSRIERFTSIAVSGSIAPENNKYISIIRRENLREKKEVVEILYKEYYRISANVKDLQEK